ncbi:nicotinate-nucleotide adenylyltransferase [Asticcacaulis tiandongensis]|uniref:nicotinate-nucleotide adenylyltransferase n=1 Tax=Asticcacaulis tiandongensis TaxID=2565365 RepID=UPI001126761A|nr:nicotinate-nucleotide adenylyltransferase [Asticcacaulis tiandongensis]
MTRAAKRKSVLRAGFHLGAAQVVGLFGGSFNPAHEGHAHVVNTARQRLGLDRVIWLVSPQNPLKSKADMTPLEARIASVAPLAGVGDVVSDFETRIGTAYTVETLRALKMRFPAVHFVWIMGADSLAQFHRWRDWKELAALMPIAVVARPGQSMKSLRSPAAAYLRVKRRAERQARLLPHLEAPAWIYLTAPLNKTSSTAIRAQKTAQK